MRVEMIISFVRLQEYGFLSFNTIPVGILIRDVSREETLSPMDSEVKKRRSKGNPASPSRRGIY